VIVSSAPMRISFLGGGSDYLESMQTIPGFVFGAAIDLRVHVMASPLPPFAAEHIRFTYRHTESVQAIQDLKHPVIRASLIRRAWKHPANIATMADVAGNSGLGSSSAFTVALELLLAKLENQDTSAKELAMNSIDIERNILKEPGGFQDQFFAAYGGLRGIEFSVDEIKALDEIQNLRIIAALESQMVLIPFGEQRNSAVFAESHKKVLGIKKNQELIHRSVLLAKQSYSDFMHNENTAQVMENLAKSMEENWAIKVENSLDRNILFADEFIRKSKGFGATAGKLCGAGTTGYIFLLCPKERQSGLAFKMNLKHMYKPRLSHGASLSLSNPNGSIVLDPWTYPQ
jgi:D-glycero-alpha-D-manno-heptose-7-phosphate kinase